MHAPLNIIKMPLNLSFPNFHLDSDTLLQTLKRRLTGMLTATSCLSQEICIARATVNIK